MLRGTEGFEDTDMTSTVHRPSRCQVPAPGRQRLRSEDECRVRPTSAGRARLADPRSEVGTWPNDKAMVTHPAEDVVERAGAAG